MKNFFMRHGALMFVLVCVVFLNRLSPQIFSLLEESGDSELLRIFFSISIIFALSFVVFHTSTGTAIPSFVAAIFYGMAAKPFLDPIVRDPVVLGTIVGLGATLILFSGGLETPFAGFKRLFWKIMSLSFIGLFLTAFLFSFACFFIGSMFGVSIPLPVCLLLGALLASTDPAAIIPVLKQLRFYNRSTKDIIISESALTDVTGTLLTITLLGLLSAVGAIPSISRGYASLLSLETGGILLKEIIFGVAFGLAGYGFLLLLNKMKEKHLQEFEADAAFFLFIPVMVFTLAVAFGGSGYLAAFVAGLLFVITKHLNQTEQFFNHTIEGFLKPTIFLLLGALVDVSRLLEYAPIGIVAALVFMCIIRPLSVFIALGPFSFFGRERFGVRELLFISFVRETGAIPAVLLATIVSMGFGGMESLVPIGMWVILCTLVVEPPLTPIVARLLRVGERMKDEKPLHIHEGTEQFVVLASRGRSYIERLPKVAEWASKHAIQRVVLLHCLEDDYTPERAEKIKSDAAAEFETLNKKRMEVGEQSVDFDLVSRTGLLQDNIDELIREEEQHVSVIFVGRKVLDYRLDQIRGLRVPLFFLD